MKTWKYVGVGILAFIGVVAVVLGLMFMSGSLQKLTANWRGGVQATEQTQADGDYRIANYDHFFDLCASIQTDEARIQNLEETATDSVKDQTTITAVKNSRAGKINQYNADAAKEATAGQFRDSGLPYELYMERETTCHVN